MSKWPKKVKYRNRVLARIYPKCQGRNSYRVSWQAGGKRFMKSFRTYSGDRGALKYAEELVKDLAKGSQAAFLSSAEASDAIAAMERLEAFRKATGRQVSLRAAVADFCEASEKLPDRTIGEAIEIFNQTSAQVRRKDLGEAIEEFLDGLRAQTISKAGQRPARSVKYVRSVQAMLLRVSRTFPGHSVSDLTRDHLDAFFGSLKDLKPKSRNHHRAAVRQFLAWSTRKDFLSRAHRLNEAEGLRPERDDPDEVTLYTPREFRKLLQGAEEPLRTMIALGGLAGIRVEELLRLDWADVWRVDGHVEVSRAKSKTRQRRLIEVCPALRQWLAPSRTMKSGKVWPYCENEYHVRFRELCDATGVERKQNALRHAFCSAAFVLHGENTTAQMAGNSPNQIHQSYKGLVTKPEARRWFAVQPDKSGGKIIPVIPAEA